MHHPAHKSLKAAYSFYNVSTVTPWDVLIQDALIVAKNVRSSFPSTLNIDYTFRGSNSVIFINASFLIGVSSLRKEFAPLGANSFLKSRPLLKKVSSSRESRVVSLSKKMVEKHGSVSIYSNDEQGVVL